MKRIGLGRSAKHGQCQLQRMATTEMRMVWWAMGVSVEHQRNEDVWEEARVEPIAMVVRRRKLEWFEHVKRRGETEKTSEQLQKWRWRGSALEEDQRCGERYCQKETESPEHRGRMGHWQRKMERYLPTTPHRETAAKGEKFKCSH